MKHIRLDLLFLFEAIISGGLAFLFGWAKEPTLAVLWLINANLSLVCYHYTEKK